MLAFHMGVVFLLGTENDIKLLGCIRMIEVHRRYRPTIARFHLLLTISKCRYSPNIVLMAVHRLRRWPNIEQHWCLLGNSQQIREAETMVIQCCTTVCHAGPTLKQHWFSV